MIRGIRPAILAVSAIVIAACSNDSNDNQSNVAPDVPGNVSEEASSEDQIGTLDWSTCPDNEALDCATLAVPMNYSNEQSGEIEIALNRLPALQQPARGVLMINGGGPGPGLDVTEIIQENELIPRSVRERYDTIGFDPRGFGQSTPISCEIADDQEQASVLYLANSEMIDTFVQQRMEVAQQCHAESGDYLLQLGSMNVVRDMESIREAVGVEKLNFVGLSYGTRLAALYLQFYPDRSDAFILDASDKPDTSNLAWAREIQPALQQNLESMLMQCSVTEPSCDADALQQLLIDKVNALVADGELEELELLLDLVEFAAFDPELGGLLVAPLAAYLLRGETEGLLMLNQLLEAEEEDDEMDENQDEEEIDISIAQRAVLCADDGFRPTSTDLLAYLQDFNTVSDFFAEYFIELAGECVGWPESPDPLPLIATSTAPTSLVIGGVLDTTSPIAWSEEMANAIGGYFLASAHDDHTVLYAGESECVDEIATEFLVDGILPSAGDCL